MAAYAALVSLEHIIDKLELHPRPPLSLHKQQVESLTRKISSLQEFLEGYNPHLDYNTEADPLESRIADAAYAAEDVIESHIVDSITSEGEKMSSDNALYEAVEKVLEEMALVEKEAMEIKQTVGGRNQLHGNSTPPNSSKSSSSVAQKSSMVGADDILLAMKNKLTSYRLDLQIIPIVGMGGTGKTTLAINIYRDRLIMEHFDICAWATISQEYSIREILREILIKVVRQLNVNENVDQHLSEGACGEMLYKHLYGRKYLIIMDDMWSIDAWDGVRWFFRDNKNGSRIVVTTRLSNLASELPNSDSLGMGLLDKDDSWDLLSKTVFGEEGCPLELEEIGKKIGESCKGLPLSIVVVGGLLAKSEHTREFWEYIEKNLNATVNLDGGERCLKILHLSYKQLPVYLKPCFLYMGVYPEDEVIGISRLTKLWVAEGILKPITGKSLEDIAREYLKDLAYRNLVLTHKLGSTGSIKQCKIHDLLRDFCLRQAEKERFYSPRRCSVIPSASKEEAIDVLQSTTRARSLIWSLKERPPSLCSRLLRILQSNDSLPCLENMLQLVNLRYIAAMSLKEDMFHSLIYRLWNLETLIVEDERLKFTLPAEIWYMPQIRHVQFKDVHLPDPPTADDADNDDDDDDEEFVILANLHTLEAIKDFKCSEEVVKRIPNIKKLGIQCAADEEWRLKNLVLLHKLESLDCSLWRDFKNINFPHSLKKLRVSANRWEDLLEKIGTLPLLEKLILNYGSFEKGKWETVEGQFPRLKFLEISRLNLVHWRMESSHFPCLEHLVLRRLYYLEEIPIEVAEISTLRSIYFVFCRTGSISSAKRIVEKQEELYGEVTLQILLRLKVGARSSEEAQECRSSPNIQFE